MIQIHSGETGRPHVSPRDLVEAGFGLFEELMRGWLEEVYLLLAYKGIKVKIIMKETTPQIYACTSDFT